MSGASLTDGAVRTRADSTVETMTTGPQATRDRDNPSLFDAIESDPVVPIPLAVRRTLVRDLRRPSRRYLFPTVRVVTTFLIHVVIFFKRLIPLRLGWLRGLSISTTWIAARFASPESRRILLRHFIIETQLVNFVARNATGGRAPEYDLLPTRVEHVGDHHNGINAIALHDANIMNLFIDLGAIPETDVETRRALTALDFSMLEMPVLTIDEHTQWFNFDLPTVLYVSALMIVVFFDDLTIERAVNSFQLDESLLTAIANLTGEESIRALTPAKFTLWMGSPTGDPARDLHWHILLHEQVYERMLRLKKKADFARRAA